MCSFLTEKIAIPKETRNSINPKVKLFKNYTDSGYKYFLINVFMQKHRYTNVI